MMVSGILLVRKGVGAVKEAMPAGNVLTVMLGHCCNARIASSPYIHAMLCIALR